MHCLHCFSLKISACENSSPCLDSENLYQENAWLSTYSKNKVSSASRCELELPCRGQGGRVGLGEGGKRERKREKGGWSQWMVEGLVSNQLSFWILAICPIMQIVRSTGGKEGIMEGGKKEGGKVWNAWGAWISLEMAEVAEFWSNNGKEDVGGGWVVNKAGKEVEAMATRRN